MGNPIVDATQRTGGTNSTKREAMFRKKLSLDEATRSKDLSGKTYIVTGANSGVGLETTRQLVRQGGHVVLACRRTDAAEEAARSFSGLKGSHEVIRLDLADLQSVRGTSSQSSPQITTVWTAWRAMPDSCRWASTPNTRRTDWK